MRSLKEIVQDLKIPTHPEFEFERDSGALDYVNPVLLNNLLVLYTNLIVELTEINLQKQQMLDNERRTRAQAEAEMYAIRIAVLADQEIPSTYAKNLQLTDAFVAKCLLGRDEERVRFTSAAARLEQSKRSIDRLESFIREVHAVIDRVEFASKNIQTHLSYVKKEQELSRYT